MKQPSILPASRQELEKNGWTRPDIILVTGDALVDHPAFGAALLARWLIHHGFSMGIIAQPDPDTDDLARLGRPRLFFGVTSGNMDSMINHYTARRKIRSSDAYSPDGKMGLRPDRAVIAYCQALRRLFKDIRIVAGGIEASLRRIPHYDLWSDRVRNSQLFDARADAIVYGMGERPILDLARSVTEDGFSEDIPGTVVPAKDAPPDAVDIPDWQAMKTPDGFFDATRIFHDHYRNHVIVQPFAGRFLRHNPPAAPLSTPELDSLYGLPFSRQPHPMYGGSRITAWEQIRDSVTAHRGCFGGCRFCTLSLHQGKQIRSRSRESILREVRTIVTMKGFGGTITDVGGPTANMYGARCGKGIAGTCPRESCLVPSVCPHLTGDPAGYARLLDAVAGVRGVRHVRVSSGIRLETALLDDSLVHDLVQRYTGGRLKVAPEHVSDRVLRKMNKPPAELFAQFRKRFIAESAQCGRNQQLVPYLIAGHPGETLGDTIDAALRLRRNNLYTELVQEFTPTPMSLSTCMYFTGRDIETGRTIHVPKGREVRLMKALLLSHLPENGPLVREALRKAGKMRILSELLGKGSHE